MGLAGHSQCQASYDTCEQRSREVTISLLICDVCSDNNDNRPDKLISSIDTS